MDKQIFNVKEEQRQLFITEIKLFINRRLYENKHISEEMYVKAKQCILKSVA